MSQLFEVDIEGARRVFYSDGYKYVALAPGAEYQITLRNNHNTRCDAEVTIDDQVVGMWRIRPYSSITIERPEGENRRFTFVAETSRIARQTGAQVGAEANGIIQVVFKPAKQTIYPIVARAVPTATLEARAAPTAAPAPVMAASLAAPRYQSGVTVLGRESEQQFSDTRALRWDEIDHRLVTTVTLRLVVDTGRLDYVPLSSVRLNRPPRIDDARPRPCIDCGNKII